jgi:hypothetical protein
MKSFRKNTGNVIEICIVRRSDGGIAYSSYGSPVYRLTFHDSLLPIHAH